MGGSVRGVAGRLGGPGGGSNRVGVAGAELGQDVGVCEGLRGMGGGEGRGTGASARAGWPDAAGGRFGRGSTTVTSVDQWVAAGACLGQAAGGGAGQAAGGAGGAGAGAGQAGAGATRAAGACSGDDVQAMSFKSSTKTT